MYRYTHQGTSIALHATKSQLSLQDRDEIMESFGLPRNIPHSAATRFDVSIILQLVTSVFCNISHFIFQSFVCV